MSVFSQYTTLLDAAEEVHVPTSHDDLPPAPTFADPLMCLPKNAATVARWRAVAERGTLAAKLEERFGNKRQDTEKYHVTAGMHWQAKLDQYRTWKPIFRPQPDQAVRAIAGDPTGSTRGVNGPQFGLGDWQLDEDNHANVGAVDIDDHEKTPESAQRCRDARDDIADLCQRLRIPFVVNKSTKGRGWHFRFWFATRWHRAKIIDFLESMINLVGSPSHVETYPKGDDLALTPTGKKIAGGQILRPYSLNAALRAPGASCFYYRVSFDDWRLVEVEDAEAHFDRWEPVDDESFLSVIEEARKAGPVDLGDRRPRVATTRAPRTTSASMRARDPVDVGFVARGEDFSTLGGLTAFLRRAGYAPTAVTQYGPGLHKVELPRCVLEELHSSKTADPALFYDEGLGAVVGHKCLHASCNAVEKLTASVVLRRMGCEVDVVHRATGPAATIATPSRAPRAPALVVPHAPIWDLVDESPFPRSTCTCDLLLPPPEAQVAPPSADPWADLPPPPLPPRDDDVGDITARALDELEPTVAALDPRSVRRRLGDPERGVLSQLVADQYGDGTKERGRAGRVLDCGRALKKRWCDAHQAVHVCPLLCGRAGACISCGHAPSSERREGVASTWGEVGAVRVDVGRSVALSDPATAYAAMLRAFRTINAIVRKRRIRGRQWVRGAHSVVFFTLLPVDAEYIADALAHAGVAHERLGTLTPMQAADLVYDSLMEPALLLEALLGSADGAAAAADFPYLTEEHARRVGRGRVGEQLPWPSDLEVRAAKKERARAAAVARGEDPDAFDHATCPRAVQKPDGTVHRCGRPLQTRVELDGVELARGRTGAPSWATDERAFAIMAAERVHRRETSHLPSS